MLSGEDVTLVQSSSDFRLPQNEASRERSPGGRDTSSCFRLPQNVVDIGLRLGIWADQLNELSCSGRAIGGLD